MSTPPPSTYPYRIEQGSIVANDQVVFKGANGNTHPESGDYSLYFALLPATQE
jgi:hypothetical protein